MKRQILRMIMLLSAVTIISSCGGGGGGGGTPPPVQPTTATIKLSVSGMLPAETLIGGIDITVSLPSGVTVKSTEAPPFTDSGVVIASGVASTSDWAPGTYTPAIDGAPAKVRAFVFHKNGFGTGEFVTVNCDIASGSSPQVNQFVIDSIVVKDLDGAAIEGMASGVAVTIK